MTLIFLLGGARSGKSSLAVELARRGGEPVVFVATGEPGDDEMRERIERHQRERPGATPPPLCRGTRRGRASPR